MLGFAFWKSKTQTLNTLVAGLVTLRVLRRAALRDDALAAVLVRHPDLEELEISGCPNITDEVLDSIPAGVRKLFLLHCDRITGDGLARLRKLRQLRLAGCPIKREVMQVGFE